MRLNFATLKPFHHFDPFVVTSVKTRPTFTSVRRISQTAGCKSQTVGLSILPGSFSINAMRYWSFKFISLSDHAWHARETAIL